MSEINTPDEQLATAIAGRAHWRVDGRVAVYAPPGAGAEVRVQPLATPTRTTKYAAALVRGGRALHNRPCWTPAEAIRWAEGQQLG